MSLRLSAEAGGLPGAGRSRILTEGVGHCLNSGKHNTFLLEVRQSRGQTKTFRQKEHDKQSMSLWTPT